MVLKIALSTLSDQTMKRIFSQEHTGSNMTQKDRVFGNTQENKKKKTPLLFEEPKKVKRELR